MKQSSTKLGNPHSVMIWPPDSDKGIHVFYVFSAIYNGFGLWQIQDGDSPGNM